MAARRVLEYLTESQIIEYFVNDSGSEVSDNEDNDPSYEPEDSVSGN